MILAQFSDPHIKREGRLAYGHVDTAGALRRCIAGINALDPRPDAVLITGDLVDFGDRAEYVFARGLLDVLAVPYFLCVGNHDDRDAMRAVFGDHATLRQHPSFVQYAVDLGPLRLVVADTQDPPRPGGRLCDERLGWIEGALDAAGDRPVLLAMHHPPFATGIEHMDVQRLAPPDAAKLAAIVARHPTVERVVCGHVHRIAQARFAGTVAGICPSPAHQVALDLRTAGPPRFAMEPPGFQLHRMVPGEPLVTHTVPLGDFGPPRPFFDEAGALID